MANDPQSDSLAIAQFEQSLKELEELVQQMEAGELSLEQSLNAYERGVGLYRHCQSALEQAQLRVQQLADPMQAQDAQPLDPSTLKHHTS